MRARSEPFASVPYRVFDALEAHELSFAQVALIAWLIGRCGAAGKTAKTLRTIKESTRYPHTLERLRQEIKELDEKGWIDAQAPTSGSTRPWSFALNEAQTVSRDLELASNGATRAIGPNALQQTDAATNEAPTFADPLDVHEIDDDVAQELARKIDELNFEIVGSQRTDFFRDPGRTLGWIAAVRPDVTNPVAWVHAMLKSGNEPPPASSKAKANRGSKRLVDVLLIYVENEGKDYRPDAVLDEIDKRERHRHERLTVDERERVLARHTELAAKETTEC